MTATEARLTKLARRLNLGARVSHLPTGKGYRYMLVGYEPRRELTILGLSGREAEAALRAPVTA